MKFPPTTQQLEEAGFDKGQAEVLAVCFVITDQRHEDIMTLFQSILSEIKALKKGQTETNQSLVAFQLETTQKFSETHQKISDFQRETQKEISDSQRETQKEISGVHASLIKWMVGTAITTVLGVSAIGAGFLWFFMRFGAGAG